MLSYFFIFFKTCCWTHLAAAAAAAGVGHHFLLRRRWFFQSQRGEVEDVSRVHLLLFQQRFLLLLNQKDTQSVFSNQTTAVNSQ